MDPVFVNSKLLLFNDLARGHWRFKVLYKHASSRKQGEFDQEFLQRNYTSKRSAELNAHQFQRSVEVDHFKNAHVRKQFKFNDALPDNKHIRFDDDNDDDHVVDNAPLKVVDALFDRHYKNIDGENIHIAFTFDGTQMGHVGIVLGGLKSYSQM